MVEIRCCQLEMNWKKIIAYIPCQVCFYIGHWTSMLIRFDCMSFLYPVYNRFMLWSCDISDWAGLNMWQDNSRVRQIATDYINMLCDTNRIYEVRNAPWRDDISKVTPDIEKKMRRELVAYKRQQER